MASDNAMRVANKVSEHIREGKLVNKGEIIRSVGYSLETSLKPKLITETKTYKAIMERARKPLLERLDQQINSTEYALSKKNLSKEDTRTLVGTLDILIKNKHLLSGGMNTVNVFVMPSEIMAKNNIIKTEDIKDDG